jgi:hypothetical protein
MFAKVPVTAAVTGTTVEFRFAGPVSIFMLVVSRGDEVAWELLANEGQTVEGAVVSVTPLDQATPEMLEGAHRAEENFLMRVREGPPPTTPVSHVRYGEAPQGYSERFPAEKLVPGRYDFTAMCAQGHASGQFDVPAA